MAHQHNTDYSCITMGTIIQTSTAILFHLEWVGIHKIFFQADLTLAVTAKSHPPSATNISPI